MGAEVGSTRIMMLPTPCWFADALLPASRRSFNGLLQAAIRRVARSRELPLMGARASCLRARQGEGLATITAGHLTLPRGCHGWGCKAMTFTAEGASGARLFGSDDEGTPRAVLRAFHSARCSRCLGARRTQRCTVRR